MMTRSFHASTGVALLKHNLDQYGNAWVSDDAWVSGNARVSDDARVSGCARVYDCAWENSPLQIQGTAHFFTVSSYASISIGCEHHTFSVWLKRYKAIGKQHGYSDSQIREYGMYIRLAIKWVQIHVPAPVIPDECAAGQ